MNIQETIRKAAPVFFSPGDVYEARILKAEREGTVSGYFNDVEKLLGAIPAYDGRFNIYWTINPVNPALRARAANKLKPRAESTTNDKDIVRRQWFPIDIDPERPSGVSSSDDELQKAKGFAVEIRDFLRDELSFPDPVVVMSGNGYHLLYRIDLPNDKDSEILLKTCLEALAVLFDNAAVKVDRTVFNASRILKIPGTVSTKGDDMPERPHRRSGLVKVPDIIIPVDVEKLKLLAARVVKRAPETTGRNVAASALPGGTGKKLDIDRWIAEKLPHPGISKEKPEGDRRILELEHCPFNPDEHRRSAIITVQENGAIGFTCHHNSCSGYKWAELRERFDPKAERRPSSHSDHSDEDYLTDLGTARRLIREYGVNLRYFPERRKWMLYDEQEGRWIEDRTRQIDRWIEEILKGYAAELKAHKERIRELEAQAKELLDTGMTVDTSKIREEAEGIKRREKYLTKHLLSSQNAARFNSIKTLAQQQPGVIALPEQFDRQRELLNCRNGTIDLNRHAFVPHDRELLLSKSTGIAYAKGADCPLWNAFLSRIMGGKAHLVEYLQRITGYILTGLIFEQIVIILYGIGANGKSTFVNMLLRLMGDYGMQASIETFIERKNPGTPNDIARMKGARLVAVSESAKGATLNEGFVKQATGGEPLQARFLYGEFFQYAPEFKILLVTNHKPHIRGTDNGIWRRIRLIPFEETIPEPEQDRRLEEKLAKELPGILNWALEGCRMWQQIGEAPPAEVKAAVEQYRRDMDLLGEFLQECCALSPRAEVPFKDLYARYLAWCEKEGEKKPVSKKGFSRSLVERGMRSIKKSGGIHYLRGIALLSCADCADCADFLVNSQAEKSDVVSWEEFQEKRRDRHNHHEKSTESIAAQEIPDRADSEDDREVFII